MNYDKTVIAPDDDPTVDQDGGPAAGQPGGGRPLEK